MLGRHKRPFQDVDLICHKIVFCIRRRNDRTVMTADTCTYTKDFSNVYFIAVIAYYTKVADTYIVPVDRL